MCLNRSMLDDVKINGLAIYINIYKKLKFLLA